MKKIVIPIAVCTALLCACTLGKGGSPEKDIIKPLSDETIEAIAEAELRSIDMGRYKQQFIEESSLKRAILIAFDTNDEAADFIARYGSAENPKELGLGTLPSEQVFNGERFFNPVGTVLESIYDVLEDNGYTATPVIYGKKYCYFRRIGNIVTASPEEIESIFGKEITLTIKEDEQNEKIE